MGVVRALLALSIVFVHSSWNGGVFLVNGNGSQGGRTAVQMFYMISGFLMALVLDGDKYKKNSKFYINRFLRIYPVYFLVLLLTLLARGLYRGNAFESFMNLPPNTIFPAVIANIIIFGQDLFYFFNISNNGTFSIISDTSLAFPTLTSSLLIPQAWTLGLELTFYLLAPFILRSSRKIIILFFSSLVLRIIFIKYGTGSLDPWTYRFLPFELALFLSGALSYRIVTPWINRLEKEKILGPAIWVTQITFVALMLVYPIFHLDDVTGSLILFSVLFLSLPLLLRFQTKFKLDNAIGELSYPIYLSHFLVIGIIQKFTTRMPFFTPGIIVVLNVVGAILVAAIINLFVSSRIERVRKRVALTK